MELFSSVECISADGLTRAGILRLEASSERIRSVSTLDLKGKSCNAVVFCGD